MEDKINSTINEPDDVKKWRKRTINGNNTDKIMLIHALSKYNNTKHEAFELCLDLCKCEYRYAFLIIARFYYNGIGIERNIDNAIKWYYKACPYYTQARIELSDIQIEMNNNEEAFKLCCDSISHPGAVIRLARMYRDGIGTEQSIEKYN